ncbi:hypothetical protein ACO0QE_001054 [Hanseniaspora vineae]
MEIAKTSSGNSRKVENDSIPISSSARSASMKIKHSNSQRYPRNSYSNGGMGSFHNPNNNSHGFNSRRQSILLLSESVQSRKSGLNMGTRTSRNSTSSTTLQNLASRNMAGSYGKSMDSKVFININSPNFKSENQDEILNSLSQQNYLNYQHRRKSNNSHAASHISSGDAVGSNSSVAVGDEDDEEDDDYGRENGHGSESPLLDEHDPHLNQEGGDITRDIYSLAKNSKIKSKLRKNKSFDDLSSLHSTSRRGSTASALNVPGGFRRHHIIQKISENGNHGNGATPTESDSSITDSTHNSVGEDGTPSAQPIENVPFLTRNFLEFLYVYGHFAGESFEDEFYPEDMKDDKIDGENTPLLMKRKRSLEKMSAKGTTSTFKAFLLMIKSFIGTGVLFLPKAFSNGGLFFCMFMLTFFGIYSFWCYYILIQSKVATKVSSFGDIGQKLYGPWMKVIILFSLVVTQLGFSAAYVVFTSTNLMAFVKNVFHLHEHLKIEWFLVFQIIVFIPLSFIRNVSKLSLPSLFANFFTMGGLLIVIFFVVKHLVIDLEMKPAEGIIYGFNPNSWSLFIGTAIFAFEGIGLIIPVQDSMKHPEQFPKVLLLVILTACVLFILVATLGYLAYGSAIDTVILLNLPQTNIFVNMIQFFYSMAILLSTPLQLFPAIAIIESKILKPRFVNHKLVTGKTDWRIKWIKNFIRSLIVIFTVGLAYFGSSNLDRFVSFVGCFACIPLVYMYPPMLHLLSCSKPNAAEKPTIKNKSLVALDYGLLVFADFHVTFLYSSMSTDSQLPRRRFYDVSSKEHVVISSEEASHTPIPVEGLTSKVSIYEPLLETFHDLHQSVNHFYKTSVLEYQNLKHATNNEIQNSKDYLNENFVVGNKHEINEKLVPSVFYSLVGFYTGRILTNPLNWNSAIFGTKSLLGKITTSLPSRLLLPIALGAYTFENQTPITYQRVGNVVKHDVLHKDTIQIIDSGKQEVEKTRKLFQELGETIDLTLQKQIHQLRQYAVDNWPF